MTVKPLQDGLKRFRRVALDGAFAGLAGQAGKITDRLRTTTAHGDDTGATRASYSARAVGNGQTGAAAHQTSVAAVEEFNPGHAATSTVNIDGLGVIIDSATDYQRYLETENAGQRAVLGPAIQAESLGLTQAAAEGSRKALS